MKFITKKVINNKEYYYLQYKKYSKCIGAYITEDIKQEMISFFSDIALKEYELLSKDIKKQFSKKDLMEVEKMHYLYICISQSEFFKEEYDKFREIFAIEFTFNSNRSEGSKTTKKDIKNYMFSKKRKIVTKTNQEIYNSSSALEYSFFHVSRLNTMSIKYIHKLLLLNLDAVQIIGVWKKENNVAPGNNATTDCLLVQKEMLDLLKWLNSMNKKSIYPPLLALEFYYRFEKIHPFSDGNGRMGRILLNAILVKYSYCPVIFFTENHESHCDAISKAISGRTSKLNMHFVEQMQKTVLVLQMVLPITI
jgi:fido (protein-threonine AMPylation protein)